MLTRNLLNNTIKTAAYHNVAVSHILLRLSVRFEKLMCRFSLYVKLYKFTALNSVNNTIALHVAQDFDILRKGH